MTPKPTHCLSSCVHLVYHHGARLGLLVLTIYTVARPAASFGGTFDAITSSRLGLGFCSLYRRRWTRRRRDGLVRATASPSAFGSGIDDENLLHRAREPLEWERQEAKLSAPFLALSARDPETLSLAEGASVDNDDSGVAAEPGGKTSTTTDEDWLDGSVWNETRRGLVELGIIADGENDDGTLLLDTVPQLLRLPTPVVLESASFLVDTDENGSGIQVLRADWILLSYRVDQLRYGLEFLANMMTRGNAEAAAALCRANPTLFRAGVQGGLQEKAVGDALGMAGAATGKATNAVVADASKALKSLKNKRDPESLS